MGCVAQIGRPPSSTCKKGNRPQTIQKLWRRGVPPEKDYTPKRALQNRTGPAYSGGAEVSGRWPLYLREAGGQDSESYPGKVENFFGGYVFELNKNWYEHCFWSFTQQEQVTKQVTKGEPLVFQTKLLPDLAYFSPPCHTSADEFAELRLQGEYLPTYFAETAVVTRHTQNEDISEYWSPRFNRHAMALASPVQLRPASTAPERARMTPVTGRWTLETPTQGTCLDVGRLRYMLDAQVLTPSHPTDHSSFLGRPHPACSG